MGVPVVGRQREAGDRPVTAAECRALFDSWRLAVMGNPASNRRVPVAVGGYLFRGPSEPGSRPAAVPLGELRRTLIGLVDRGGLTHEERFVVRTYYGLDGLPLPFASSSGADIAGGRDESSPRGTCRAGLAKVAAGTPPRPLGPVPPRPVINPLLEPWFRVRATTAAERCRVVARAFVRAVAACDGPYAPPTLAALARWYETCGYADPDLEPLRRRVTGRPNRNALARASALMELALHEEVSRSPTPHLAGRGDPPAPASPEPASPRSTSDHRTGTGGETGRGPVIERVTQPDLRALAAGDPSPRALTRAAAVLQDEALHGGDVTGRLALLLRCVRPRIGVLPAADLERLAVSITYIAAVTGHPFLGLEWLGHFLRHAGITDRTFTVLVNTVEAASSGGYHHLADRVHQLYPRLQSRWRIPDHQVPLVEHVEVEQQRLVARAFQYEQLAVSRLRAGDEAAAVDSLRRSVDLAARSAGMAYRVLTDRDAFPDLVLPGKAGRHGGDLTWPWLLAATLRITEPAKRLHDLLVGGDPAATAAEAAASAGADAVGLSKPSGRSAPGGPASRAGLRAEIRRAASTARGHLADYEGTFDSPRFVDWYRTVEADTARLLRV